MNRAHVYWIVFVLLIFTGTFSHASEDDKPAESVLGIFGGAITDTIDLAANSLETTGELVGNITSSAVYMVSESANTLNPFTENGYNAAENTGDPDTTSLTKG